VSTAVVHDVDAELAAFVADFYDDPEGFVFAAYPWGKTGTPLAEHKGPDTWQREFLRSVGDAVKEAKFNGVDAVRPIRRAISSGHGIGKSVMAAWLVDWIMSTRPGSQGTVTANTFKQLETKTWAAIKHWTSLCITRDWFVVGDQKMYHRDFKDSWFCAPQSCKEENSEAFAGQHAAGATSFYVVDEASAIPDKIFEVAEGGLTDGEPMIFMFGNPTQSTGYFYRACFGGLKKRWESLAIDSRDCRFTNKVQLQEWIDDYGIDSDFVRVRVLGLPPSASDAQFIDSKRVLDAQKRSVSVLSDEPLVAGCDMAWGGKDDNVIRFRRGLDAASIKPIRIKGEFTREPHVLVNRLGDVLSQDYDGQKVAMLFLDSAGIAGPVAARLRELGHRNVQEVNFGAHSPSIKFRYMRDFIWGEMKEWLLSGCIDSDPELEADLVGPMIRPDGKQRVWLESKEDMARRGVDSPDDGDALALTFAAKVARTTGFSALGNIQMPTDWGWS